MKIRQGLNGLLRNWLLGLLSVGALMGCSSMGGGSEGSDGITLTHLSYHVTAVPAPTINIDNPGEGGGGSASVPGVYTLRAAIDPGPNVIESVALSVYKPGGFADESPVQGSGGVYDASIGKLELCDRIKWRWSVSYKKDGPGGEDAFFLSSERTLIVDKFYNNQGGINQALCSE